MIVGKKQNGVALLLAILIVALVSIISTQMITQRQLQIYRTANLYFRGQAHQFSFAVERWGMSALSQDYEQDVKNLTAIDSHQDIWNTALSNFKVEQVKLDGSIIDLQGRFNLNNLVNAGKVQSQWLASYKRLLGSLDLPLSLAETLLDWIDVNENPTGSAGAEDIYYISLEHGYRTANQPLVHLSELLLIKGYTEEVYVRLQPYVFVAPEQLAVNINTCTDKVLQAIIPGLAANQAETLLTQVETNPFSSVGELLNDLSVKDQAVDPGQLSISSSYFAVNSQVSIDKTTTRMQSIINRDDQGNVRVLNRQDFILYHNEL